MAYVAHCACWWRGRQAVVIVTIVAFVQEYRSDQSLAALSQLAPPQCRVRRDGQVCQVSTCDVVIGDVVELTAGDRVPADLRLVLGVSLRIDEATLTGETRPAAKTHHRVEGPTVELSDRSNCAFMGTNVVQGRGVGVVVSVGDQTEFGAVFAIMRDSTETRTPLQVGLSVCVCVCAPRVMWALFP